MSQLNSNTAALQEILATVNALPEAGGGSGGAEIETCTIVFADNDAGALGTAYVTVLQDGAITVIETPALVMYSSYTVENVVCGSAVTVEMPEGMPTDVISITNLLTLRPHRDGGTGVYQAPSTNTVARLEIVG